jgi:large subunit ribosomal protein L10
MAKTREQKDELLKQVKEKLADSKGVVLADYTGLKVVETEDLRNKFKEENVDMIAIKKTLLKKVLEEVGYQELDKLDFSGSIAIAISDDEVTPARIINEFSKAHEAIQFRGGILEGKAIDISGVKELASLPSKDELYAKLVGSINAPVSGFVNVLAGNLRGLVNVLNSIKDNK